MSPHIVANEEEINFVTKRVDIHACNLIMFCFPSAEEQMEVLRTITDHCLPKLVCELYSKQLRSSLTDHEVSLMQLIG